MHIIHPLRCLPYLLVLALLSVSSPPARAANNSSPAPASDGKPSGLSQSDWDGIRAAHEAYTHEVRKVEGGWEAHNPAQQWTTTFDGRGFVAKPVKADWTWGLELRAYGAGTVRRAAAGAREVKTEGHRLAYHWDDTVQEWFVNDGRGLEHGFSVQERPPGPVDAPLTFLLATRGPLTAKVTSDARAVDYRDASGKTALTYSGLRVWDADGRELAARFLLAKEGVELQVNADGARYPLLIDPIAQQGQARAPEGAFRDIEGAGVAVAIWGDRVVVGMPKDPDMDIFSRLVSRAFVFRRDGTNWVQEATLKSDFNQQGPISDSESPDPNLFQRSERFGQSVAIAGDTVVVGAPAFGQSVGSPITGAAYVFVRDGTNWNRQALLQPSNPGDEDCFGQSVAVSGNTVLVGAPGEDSNAAGINGNQNSNNASDSGAAYVFVRSGTNWAQQAYLKASNTGTGDEFGGAVALEGNTIVVGASEEDTQPASFGVTAPNNNASESGAAYVFVRNGTSWTQQAFLKASNAGPLDYFGGALALSGNTVVVGAPGEDSNAKVVNGDQANNSVESSGAAYVFVRSGTKWAQQAYLKASNAIIEQFFGQSVAADGDVIMVGGTGNQQQVVVFVRGSGSASASWSEQTILQSSPLEYFGYACALRGGLAVVGAPSYGSYLGELGTGAFYSFSGLDPSSDANLLSLALSAGAYSPVFGSLTSAYAMSVPFVTAKTTVTPRAMQSTAKIEVRVNGAAYAVVPSGKASSALGLNLGANTVDVKVTSPDAGTSKVYTVAVTRLGAVDLAALSLSQGTLSPAFAAATTSYTASVAHASDSITVRPRAVNSGATIQVRLNGGPFANVPSDSNSPTLPLGLGNNTIEIKLDHGPSTKTYTVLVNRPPSYSSSLSGFNHLIESNVVYSTIGGGWGNTIRTNAIGVAVGGGGSNTAGGFYSTLPGGLQNTTLADYSALSGGRGNFITNRSSGSVIAGGIGNRITATDLPMITVDVPSEAAASIGGGFSNAVSGRFATVGGGQSNQAVGPFATVPGGQGNVATTDSFAAGTKAKATNVGTFVWADSQSDDFGSTTNNQFLIRAQGGVGINTNNPGSNALSVNGTVQIGTIQILTGTVVPTMDAPDGSLYINTSGTGSSTLWIRANGAWLSVAGNPSAM